MREQRHGTSSATVVAMVLASIVIHLLLRPIGDQVLRLGGDAPPLPSLGGGVMEVTLQEDPEAEPRRESDPPGRLVKLDRVPEERAPKESDRVSEFDSRTAKETRAPKQRPEDGRSAPAPGMLGRADSSEARARAEAQASGGARSREIPEGAGEDALGGRDDARGRVGEGAGAAQRAAEGEQKEEAAAKAALLRGNPDQLRSLFGQPGSMDDLQGVEEAGETVLNSKRWKYSSFFNRVRDAVAYHWHPEVRHAARDPEGRIYGTTTRVTRLLIRLYPDGSLSGVRVDRSSDVDFLDEEALRAVRAAQPFSNPPEGLVDPATGFIEFGFAFVFEIGESPRIHRYRR
ncbi:MAG: energy transducer TonB [Nannocystis sp.]|nr:energy transducer TonB [Nannocystis sp.]